MSKTAVAKNGHTKNRVADAMMGAIDSPIAMHAMKVAHLLVTVKGTTPLICHNWDEKTKRQMLDKQQKKAGTGRKIKDPEADFQASLYKTPDGRYGFPARAFKKSCMQAAHKDIGLARSIATPAIKIYGPGRSELVILQGPNGKDAKPKMREDMVRVGSGMNKVPDIRFRGEFSEWSCTLYVELATEYVSVEQFVNLVNRAGFLIGVGEDRGEKGGNFGGYEVENAKDAPAK
jgi:hypothetical protein